jgi:Mg/Co/Ni transporter MgtE
MDRAVPTCGPDELVGDVMSRLGDHRGVCIVINEHRVVLGRLRLDRLDPEDTRRAEDVMEPGPATVRADADLEQTTERMRARRVPSVIVSTPEGVLLGLVRAEPRE